MVHEPRMLKIFMLRGLGFNQREIADRLEVSQQTVSYNLKLMKSKSEINGPEKYFRSLLPYFSEWKKPVIPGDSADLMEEKILKMFRKKPVIPGDSVDSINETMKGLQIQFKKEFKKEFDHFRNEEMSQTRMMFTKMNEEHVRIFEDQINKLSKKVKKSGVDTDGED